MARKKKKKGGGKSSGAWLVTFSDMMTLLLTFFVLLLSMSSMDKSIIRQVSSVFTKDIAFMSTKTSGKVEKRFEILRKAIEKPWEILEKKKRIKDLLFPDTVLPPEINKSTLEENLKVLKRPEGVSLVLTDKLLFPLGKTSLNNQAREILEEVAKLARIWPAPVNVAGYTDDVPSPERGNMRISEERALAVLNYFLEEKNLDPQRFSVSAYGRHLPIADNETPAGRARNRRVEILFKDMPHSYM